MSHTENFRDQSINEALKKVLEDDDNHFNHRNRAEKNAKIVEKTINSLLDLMKEICPLFKYMFRKIIFTGSYYEKLRVTNPTEFDLNLVLHLPVNKEDVVLLEDPGYPDFVGLKISNHIIKQRMAFYPDCKVLNTHPSSLFFYNGYLSRCSIQQWMDSVIEKALDDLSSLDEVYPVMCQKHGPAFTLKIYTNGDTISVDLSPVLDGSNLPFPSQIKNIRRLRRMNPEAQKFVLVPKSLNGPSDVCDEKSDLWRISFPQAQKQLLPRKGCMKSVIKLIIRDRHHMESDIYSFLITAVFIDLLHKYPQWPENLLGLRFVQSLRSIRDLFSSPHPFLEHYFIKANILNHIQETKLHQFANVIDKILEKIEASPGPDDIEQIFRPPSNNKCVQFPLAAIPWPRSSKNRTSTNRIDIRILLLVIIMIILYTRS